MASQNGNIGLVIHARVGYVGQKSIYASGTYRGGEHNREYGLLFHSDSIENNLASAIGFNLPPKARLYKNRVDAGFNLSLTPSNFVLSALKRAEDGNGIILRFYNVLDQESEAVINITENFTGVKKVELNETDNNDNSTININDGVIKLSVKAKEIISLRLM